ncbi:recombinase family protein, partial [Candidatus Saccharibacteria bacterium]|nr:recombinase family protein [Candidatus Saccharibacteria bacterium]
MAKQYNNSNAVAAIRASSAKQGTDGDSPEAQKEQIERFATTKGIKIKKFFVFLESASKEQQPVQEAIDYCKDTKNNIDICIIKSIDRFTRGGSDMYTPLKKQLDQADVALVDLYGVISGEKVNTLEHTGFEYSWSVYSPSKKSEILEAERAKDEMRDIMSRMIGAEIRYTKLGYWMRRPPYGYQSKSTDSANGKRMILEPHKEESQFIMKMYKLRSAGLLSDEQIVTRLNNQGFKSRTDVLRDKQDRTRIVGKRGGVKLTVKTMRRYLKNPIYAGIICEKWIDNQPVKCE